MKKMHQEDLKYLQGWCQSEFLHGQCYSFAIALHRDLGWEMIGLVRGDEIPHVVLCREVGRYFDARGDVPLESLGEPFSLPKPYTMKAVTEKELRAIQSDLSYSTIDRAAQMAAALWPELPWKKESLPQRMLAFANDLEKLSKKHGFWIFGSSPALLPLVAEAHGDEGGYDLCATSNGRNYTINRRLEDELMTV